MSKDSLSTAVWLCLGVVWLVGLVYICSYYLLLEPAIAYRCSPDTGGLVSFRVPAYRIADEELGSLFRPLSMLDRMVRPKYWDPGEPLIIPDLPQDTVE